METRSTTECLQLAFKLRRFAVERGHPIPQVTTFADLSGETLISNFCFIQLTYAPIAEFFAHLFVALCGPYVDEIRVDPELKEDEILLVQSVIDALAVDLLSLSLPHLNAAVRYIIQHDSTDNFLSFRQ